MKSHLAQKHKEIYREYKKEGAKKLLDYECPECDSRFENKNGLSVHILRGCDKVEKGSETWDKGCELRSDKNAPMYGRERSQEFKNTLSIKQSGERNPQYGKTGEKSPNWNRDLTGEHKEKVMEHLENIWSSGPDNPNWKGKIDLECEQCSAEFSVMKHREERARFCSQKCRDLWVSENLNGPDAHAWKGGVSREPYPFEFSPELKQEIRSDNDFQCVLCGMNQEENKEKYGKKLIVHHINYDKQDCRHENLTSLCSRCHGFTNHNKRRLWIQYFNLISN